MSKKILYVLGITSASGLCYHYYDSQKYRNPHFNDLDFNVRIKYCVGCGFHHSAEFFSKKVLEVYPNAKFNMNPTEDQPGALEIYIKMKPEQEEQLIHSALKGEGRIYRDNIQIILKRLEDFIKKV